MTRSALEEESGVASGAGERPRFHYSAFGSRLASDLEFPELRPLDVGPSRWSFRVVEALPEMVDPAALGEEAIYGDVKARLLRHSRGHRIEVCDTGSFEILSGGEILWRPTDEPWWDFGRGHLLGRVLATALFLEGIHTLHGSAVQFEDGVVGFLAPKFTGKSTLALHLCRGGAALVTDDSLPVEITPEGVLAHPGVHSIRLRTMEEAGEATESTGRDGKFRLTDLPMDRRMEEPSPLRVLYFLRSVQENEGGVAVRRAPLPGPLQAMRLLAFAKIGEMLGTAGKRFLFESAVALSERVRVEELTVVRDHQRLPEVVEQLLSWHGGPGPGAKGSGTFP
jgi:hypothetical protein